ncbi:TetR/AcrR family transcriptional regulator [Actinomadura atramentaria]|uniref:TetR/AcrR family transcriptional regulator n=1 Tax=Actinomadura atramentaria TaxID=1990 RepID=UPI000376E9E1|nr:TetR/AcrR family transcriptional regulator [Actinomadura atramentaria]
MTARPDGLRARRTRKLLRDALIELIEERGFDRITVNRLTERAMVSRAAFYRAYRDKYHLVEQVFEEALDVLVAAVAEDDCVDTRVERWIGFFEHVGEYRRLYGALLGDRGSPWFAAKMRATLERTVAGHFPDPAADTLTPALVAAMFVQAITWWLENDRPVSEREIALRTIRVSAALLADAGIGRPING